jgi:hypothetical protein
MSHIPTFFETFPQEPGELSTSNAIARLIDGLGYRLYWALYGLREKECQFGATSICPFPTPCITWDRSAY